MAEHAIQYTQCDYFSRKGLCNKDAWGVVVAHIKASNH